MSNQKALLRASSTTRNLIVLLPLVLLFAQAPHVSASYPALPDHNAMVLKLERAQAAQEGVLYPDTTPQRCACGTTLLELFPPTFTVGLIAVQHYGFTVYPITLQTDDNSGAVIFRNADNLPFFSVGGNDPNWTPSWIADLYNITAFHEFDTILAEIEAKRTARNLPDDGSAYEQAFMAAAQYYRPSHLIHVYTLVSEADYEAYQAVAYPKVIKPKVAAWIEPVTNLTFTAFSVESNGVAFTLEWPPEMLLANQAIDLFHAHALEPSCWSSLIRYTEIPTGTCSLNDLITFDSLPPPVNAPYIVTTNAAQTITNIVWLPYSGEVVTNIIPNVVTSSVSRCAFFRAADTTDSDNDGLTDAAERWVWHSDPADPDSDGDGIPDGWEAENGLSPTDAWDAILDPDHDGIPNIYEWAHGTNPQLADNHIIQKLTVSHTPSGTHSFSSIRDAFSASLPYAIIEIKEGVYAFKEQSGAFFPPHPVLLMSDAWGRNRQTIIVNDHEYAAFLIDKGQDNRTIIRGLTVRLTGAHAYQMGFWLGDGSPFITDTGVTPFFDGVTVELGRSTSAVGFFCRHHAPGTLLFNNCVVVDRWRVGNYAVGLYAIDSANIQALNCTFVGFNNEVSRFAAQLESTLYTHENTARVIEAKFVNCLWSTAPGLTTEPFVKLEKRWTYDVSLINCIVPNAPEWFPPNTVEALTVTNLPVAAGGHLRSANSAAIAGGITTPFSYVDFEGHQRTSPPDIGADEWQLFPSAQDSDGDTLGDNSEVTQHATNIYNADTDGDSISDAVELSQSTDPNDYRSVNRTVSGTIRNYIFAEFTNIVTYAFDDAPVMGANIVTQFTGNSAFSFPFSFTPSTNLWLKVACDMSGDGTIDPTLEPVYVTQFVTVLPPPTITIFDHDGDGVNDWLENQYGSDPTDPNSCFVTVTGALTNLYSETLTNYVSYGLTSTGWNVAAVVPIVKEGTFEFTKVPAHGTPTIYVRAFCDLNSNGIRDDATEPLYLSSISDFSKPTTSIIINDYDKDGVPDIEEVAEGTDPADRNNFCFQVSGVFTNALTFDANLRFAYERTQNYVTNTVVDFTLTNGPYTLPHTVTTVMAGWHLRCYDDHNTNGVYDSHELSRIYGFTRQSHDVKCDIIATDLVFDKDNDEMPDLWERNYDAVTIGINDAMDDPDGDGLINLHEYFSGTNPGIHDVTPESNALLNATYAIDSRIAGKNPTNALPLFLNYIPNGNNGIFIRNPDCWAADIDLTCCSPWNSDPDHGKNEKAGTLISPRHVLFAAHYPVTVNNTIKFVDRFNNVIVRTIIAKTQHPNYNPYLMIPYPDLAVGFLDDDVPTNRIKVAKVLPDDFRNYFGKGKRVPVIRLDQEEKVLIGDLWSISPDLELVGASQLTTCTTSINFNRQMFYETIIVGDSGNPAFLVVGKIPILLTVWTSGGSGAGTSIACFKQDVNTMMLQLESINGCTNGYQLEEFDLSAFIQCR